MALAPVSAFEDTTMRSPRAPFLALALGLCMLTGCICGPNRLSRGWDDEVNTLYSKSPWVHGALLQEIIPVYPIVGFFMSVGDFIVLNTWYFWTDDAWDGHGAGFVHTAPPGPKTTGKVWD